MVEWKKLKDVCRIERGVRVVRKNLQTDGEIPVFQNSLTPLGYYKESNYPENTTYIICAGAAGEIGFSNKPFWAADDCSCLVCPISVISKYLYYSLYVKQHILKSRVRKASVPRLSRTDVENIQIPIPSLSEQERIVGILDTFTSAIDNLNKQIALRKKQYIEYRDALLDLEGIEGVSMKTLGEIGTFIRGSGIQKSDFVEEGFDCIHYGQIHTKYGISAKETFSKITESLYNKSKKASYGDVILATTSEDAEGVAKPVVWLGENDVAISGDAYIFHHNQNGKYLAYVFSSHRFSLFKIKNATGTKVVRISGDSMAKFKFPLPSKLSQDLIVFILDKFEAIIANLEKQLALREKQYEYYRNKLLTFD